MDEIRGIIRKNEIATGSKSDGIYFFLELPDGEEQYKLYRKDEYPVDDCYFNQFSDKEVIVRGDIQNDEWVMVDNIIETNVAE